MTTPAVTEISRNGNPIGESVDDGFRAREAAPSRRVLLRGHPRGQVQPALAT